MQHNNVPVRFRLWTITQVGYLWTKLKLSKTYNKLSGIKEAVGGRPPQYAAAPVTLTFDLESGV